MIIGLVLNDVPSISETFLINKIKGLNQNGHKVILFANHKKNFHICKLVAHPKVSKSILLNILNVAIAFIKLFFRRPLVFFRFLYLEKIDGVSICNRWKNLYINWHILNQNLDWIHFAFATVSLRRENIADAICAKMGVSLRGYDISIYPLKNPNCYERLWEKVDKVHAISYDLLKVAGTHGLKKHTPNMIIQPAIDTKLFNIGEKKWKKINNKGEITFLTIARLHWKKGLEYTLQALAILKEKKFQIQYNIIGEGDEFERLKFTVHQLGINDHVDFIGTVSHQNIKKYYEEADIYLQYSIQEGFCNAALEAQIMGLITIVSDAEGLQENVIDGETGWVVPKREPSLLAEKIENVLYLEDDNLIKIYKNSIARVRKEFNLQKQYQKFYGFFD